MSRLREDSSGSENDDFPDLDTLVHRARKGKEPTAQPSNKAAKTFSVRRRKLAPLADSVLLKPWSQEPASQVNHAVRPSTIDITNSLSRLSVQLGTSKQELALEESSEVQNISSLDLYGSEDPNDGSKLKHRAGPASPRKQREPLGHGRPITRRKASSKTLEKPVTAEKPGTWQGGDISLSRPTRTMVPEAELLGAMNCLRIDDLQAPTAPQGADTYSRRPETPPPSTPPKLRRGLVSPQKLPRIPTTPHHPDTELFWSKDFVDDWNEEHSPKKQLFPDVIKRPSKQNASPSKKGTRNKTSADREAKKAFETAKHDIAQSFLRELDETITRNRISELAETTGGIKLVWTNKLNTTAGRANWKRETVRTRNADGSETSVTHRHHASIELAEKVIDDEHRLLNVIAHEFCHLANFMVSGITNNPHGKEFKAWASECSRRFGDRGIEVTTKHSYDIDFKYVWECISCATEYKRHSKSINSDRHRCGSCKSQLKQMRPVPRASARKPSEYQMFMKEQMRLLRDENPKSPQKDIMKQVADRWSSLQVSSKTIDKPLQEEPSVNEVALGIEGLDLSCGRKTVANRERHDTKQ